MNTIPNTSPEGQGLPPVFLNEAERVLDKALDKMIDQVVGEDAEYDRLKDSLDPLAVKRGWVSNRNDDVKYWRANGGGL